MPTPTFIVDAKNTEAGPETLASQLTSIINYKKISANLGTSSSMSTPRVNINYYQRHRQSMANLETLIIHLPHTTLSHTDAQGKENWSNRLDDSCTWLSHEPYRRIWLKMSDSSHGLIATVFCTVKSSHGLIVTVFCTVESWHEILANVYAPSGPHIDDLRPQHETLATRRKKRHYDER